MLCSAVPSSRAVRTAERLLLLPQQLNQQLPWQVCSFNTHHAVISSYISDFMAMLLQGAAAGASVGHQQQSADAASAADQEEEHTKASDTEDACSVVSQFDDDSHHCITNFSVKQAPVFELHIDEQLRAQLPRNDAEYSTSFIHDLMLGRGIRPPAELHQNHGKRVKYLLSTRSVALPRAAEGSQQLRTSNIISRLHGPSQLPKDVAALSQVAAHTKALVQVASAAAAAAKAEAALAMRLGCKAAAAAAQERAAEAVAVADSACKDAVAAAGELHSHTALLAVLEQEHTLRLAWQGYTCKQAAAAGGELAGKEDACEVAVERCGKLMSAA
jgi:hypothetical protein